MPPALSRITQFASSLSRAKSLAVLGLCVIAVGLAAWIMRGDAQDLEDGLVDDDLFPELKLNGALGVSDSASDLKTGPGAPFLLPNGGEAVAASSKLEEQDSDGPLFPGQFGLGGAAQPIPNKIETAAFTQAPAGMAKPAVSGTSRVTSNQPVWLTGTIELETSEKATR